VRILAKWARHFERRLIAMREHVEVVQAASEISRRSFHGGAGGGGRSNRSLALREWPGDAGFANRLISKSRARAGEVASGSRSDSLQLSAAEASRR